MLPRSPAVVIAAFFSNHTLDHLLNRYGYAAIFVFVMIESLGVPFPGETMVIAASLYAGTTHHLSPWLIWAIAAAGAIVGDNIGFGIGHWGGFRLLRRYGRKIHVNESELKVGKLVFARHGGKVVFFGRFVSILRTYAAFLAGTNRMRYLTFLAFNAAGGIVWAGIYAIGFYYLGSALKGLRGPVDYGIGGVAAVIVVGFIIWTRRHAKELEEEAEKAYPGPLDADGKARSREPGAPDHDHNHNHDGSDGPADRHRHPRQAPPPRSRSG